MNQSLVGSIPWRWKVPSDALPHPQWTTGSWLPRHTASHSQSVLTVSSSFPCQHDILERFPSWATTWAWVFITQTKAPANQVSFLLLASPHTATLKAQSLLARHVPHDCNLSAQEAEAGGSLSLWPGWSTWWILGQPGLHKETRNFRLDREHTPGRPTDGSLSLKPAWSALVRVTW